MMDHRAKGVRSVWFYGRQVVREILESGQPIQKILVASNSQEKGIDEIFFSAKQKGISIQEVPKKVLDSLLNVNHQGVAVQMSPIQDLDFKSFLNRSLNDSKQFVSLLDEVQDPHNLGAIIRSAVCFGCSGLVIPKWRSATVTDTVMKSSSGAAIHLPIFQVSNLNVIIERAKEKGFFIYGADPAGRSIHSVKFQFPLAIILGNEHRGIKPILKNRCDELIAIPQMKTIASLNVSIAAAIFFYEISRSLNSS